MIGDENGSPDRIVANFGKHAWGRKVSEPFVLGIERIEQGFVVFWFPALLDRDDVNFCAQSAFQRAGEEPFVVEQFIRNIDIPGGDVEDSRGFG